VSAVVPEKAMRRLVIAFVKQAEQPSTDKQPSASNASNSSRAHAFNFFNDQPTHKRALNRVQCTTFCGHLFHRLNFLLASWLLFANLHAKFMLRICALDSTYMILNET